MTTFMIAWHRTMHTPLTTSTERRAHSLRLCCLVFIRTHTCTLAQAQVRVFHVISMCMVICPLFLFLNYLKSLVNLHSSCNESMDSTDELLPPSPQVMSPRPTTSTRPQSSPTCSSWTRRRSSPTKSLLRTPTTMTLHSKTCSTKYNERKPITLYEKTCLSVCRRRQCPIEQGELLEIDRGDPVSTETQKHRLGLCSTIKKSRFLQNASTRISSSSSRRRATTPSRTTIAAKVAIS